MEEAPIIQPMGYRFFPLSIAESKSAKYWGWNFISQNKDRLINIDLSNYEYQTYSSQLISIPLFSMSVTHRQNIIPSYPSLSLMVSCMYFAMWRSSSIDDS